jgi:hypothetical protein
VRKGDTRWTQRVPEKRCQPFPMIPLERWNVERQEHFCGKRMMTKDGTAYHPHSYSPSGTEVKTTCHRPLERSGKVDTVATMLARTTRTFGRECVHLSVCLTISGLAQDTYIGGSPTVVELVLPYYRYTSNRTAPWNTTAQQRVRQSVS